MMPPCHIVYADKAYRIGVCGDKTEPELLCALPSYTSVLPYHLDLFANIRVWPKVNLKVWTLSRLAGI